jgi:hypothetical protein
VGFDGVRCTPLSGATLPGGQWGYMNTAIALEDFSLPPTKQFTLRLAPDVAEWLQARARADQRSLAFIVMELVRAEMTREQKAKKTRKR